MYTVFVLLLRIKKAEMKDDGRHARDLADQYAFLLFRDSSVMAKVIKQGLVARQMPFNALGKALFFLILGLLIFFKIFRSEEGKK